MCIRVGFIKKGRCFVPVIGRICIGECFSCRVIEMDVSPRVGIEMGVSPRVGIAMETQKSDALSLNDRVVDSELLRDGAGVVPGGGASSRFGFWW